MNKRICILYTGGTIGMTRTENGFAPQKGYFAGALAEIRDLQSPDMPVWDLVEFEPLLDSSNITYREWNRIAREIAERYDRYDGFVVLHGTDTMAYTASALSFMLEGLDKPVVFTGSQIPLSELRSDAKDNLITSLMIAGQGIANEVSLYFGNQLLRGNRATKSSADGLIAFTSPNYPVLAHAGISIDYNRDRLLHWAAAGRVPFHATEIREASIGVIKLFPGIRFDLFAPIVTPDLKGLVLETFGTGNIPSYDAALPPLIAKAIENGTTVVVLTQCPQGTVRLGAYETSSALARAGAVSGYNMTTEATVTKLAYLFSLGLPDAEVRRLMAEDLRGELTK
ncbi:MAG: asparaginase [Mogibacterium sp.]|nr:asparaginase [Mogibacterium sp.]